MNKRTIVLTNDDGYTAPGLLAAFHALRPLGSVHVVAPRTERSGCSHSITLGKTITVERLSLDPFGTVFAVEGSPADCVRLAVAELVEDSVDLIVSGINRGANAGIDLFYSGTVAAAREGAILGVRSISVSQAVRGEVETDWEAASRAAALIIPRLIDETLPGPGFWSVNFPSPLPDEPERHIHRVPVAMHAVPMKFHRRARDDGRVADFTYGASYWTREETGFNDYNVIRNGGIAISVVPLYEEFPSKPSCP